VSDADVIPYGDYAGRTLGCHPLGRRAGQSPQLTTPSRTVALSRAILVLLSQKVSQKAADRVGVD